MFNSHATKTRKKITKTLIEDSRRGELFLMYEYITVWPAVITTPRKKPPLNAKSSLSSTNTVLTSKKVVTSAPQERKRSYSLGTLRVSHNNIPHHPPMQFLYDTEEEGHRIINCFYRSPFSYIC
jgi:hypothetical protein